MSDRRIKRALISVYDKTGIVDFARTLVDEFSLDIISTGGTARLLSENGIPATPVELITSFPEMMDGRVKTLHPMIHAAILADRDNSEHMRQLEEQGIEPIDVVVVNLYPFQRMVADPQCTFEQAVEMIDIGGPCLLRAAAKNHKHVLVVPDVETGRAALEVIRRGDDIQKVQAEAAVRAFEMTCAYDAAVSQWLASQGSTELPTSKHLQLREVAEMRYGENPHQQGRLFRSVGESSDSPQLVRACDPEGASQAMSFNNYVDATAARGLCEELSVEFGKSAGLERSSEGERGLAICTFIKHTNACGVGAAGERLDAYRDAYLGDPNAAMGGILACSFPVDGDFATAVMETYARWGKAAGAGGFFVEVWIAPLFDSSALRIIRTSKPWGKRVRLLAVGDAGSRAGQSEFDHKEIAGGMLVQTRDTVGLNENEWKVVTKRTPTDSELADLRLAWLVCKHTKSNAITICKDGMLIGNGAGQASRVMSCRIATWLAKDNGHGEKLTGSAAASDAFFPFADGPSLLMDAGVTALIQPGGSKRDEDTISACDERNIAMIFTGTRHFKH